MKRDYRNTQYCQSLVSIEDKKKELESKISNEHPRAKIMYNQIRPRDGEYLDSFMRIYNYKCAYCGASIKSISFELFEVDHFICESAFDSTAEAGKVENLVLSCSKCNRGKGKFLIKGEYVKILNPDTENICRVFNRDSRYYIRISDDYNDDDEILAFYEKLKLKYQVRRLDYLLMNMKGLYEKIKDKSEASLLAECIVEVENKRKLF